MVVMYYKCVLGKQIATSHNHIRNCGIDLELLVWSICIFIGRSMLITKGPTALTNEGAVIHGTRLHMIIC